jgi:outer membrane protein TolC
VLARGLVFLSVLCGALPAQPINEQAAVLRALGSNADIRVYRLAMQSDSLAVESVRSGWLPQADMAAGGYLTPLDTSSFSRDNVETLASDGRVSVGQALPGGGTVSAAASAGAVEVLDRDSVAYARTLSVGVTQPLLMDAWQHGSVEYAVRIRGLENREFTLAQQKQILAAVSSVRTLYWDLYEAEALCGVFALQRDYAEQRMRSVRERFRLGTAPMIDTLSALLEYLTASQRFLEATSGRDIARLDLSVALMTAPDSIAVDTSSPPSVSPLPPPERFIEQVRRFDPGLRVFETAARKLELQIEHARNQMLPRLDAGASYRFEAGGDSPLDRSNALLGNAVVSLVMQYSLPSKPRRIARRQAELGLQENEISRELRLRELSRTVYDLTQQWEKEQQVLAIAAASASIAQKQYAAAETGYRLGTIDRLALLEAQNNFIDSSVKLVQKQVAMKKLEIIFDEITGNVLTRFGVSFE